MNPGFSNARFLKRFEKVNQILSESLEENQGEFFLVENFNIIF